VNAPDPNRKKQRRRKPNKKPQDMWRSVPAGDAPEPILPSTNPTALLTSLGTPPLPGQGAAAEHYIATVIERAAAVATALAASADLLASPTDD
jgi:hypothetical protein